MKPLFFCDLPFLKIKEKTIQKKITFTCNRPGIISISGANGAGKTTLLKTISGLYPSETYQLSGEYLKSNKSIFLTSSQGLMPEITGRDHIRLLVNNPSRKIISPEDFFEFFSDKKLISDIFNLKTRELSQGMRQALRLYLHLCFCPKLVFLDEPFVFLNSDLKSIFIHFLEKKLPDSIIFYFSQEKWPGSQQTISEINLDIQ